MVRLSRKPGNLGPELVKRLAGCDIKGLHIRPSKSVVRDGVLGNRDELNSLPLRRDDMDSAWRIERFGSAAALVQTGGGIEISLRIDAHAVRAPSRGEVIVDSHITDRTVGLQIVSANHPSAALHSIGFDKIERVVVW